MPQSTDLIYLDHQATTPVDPIVLDAMLPFFSGDFGNASSHHLAGRRAALAVDDARDSVGALIDGRPSGVVFTSGATEANNLVLQGAAGYEVGRPNVVVCRTEHLSVLDTVAAMAKSGTELTLVDVDTDGRINLDDLRAKVTTRTALVSVMLANNEIGTVAPVAEIADIAHASGALFHCDATQGVGRLPISVRASEIDFLTLSAHKLYGPKGVGAVHVSRRGQAVIEPIIHGGGHERGLRSGTLNVPGVVGLGRACEVAGSVLGVEEPELERLAGRLHAGVMGVGDVILNGPISDRLPGNRSYCFGGVDGEDLLLRMPQLAASTGSACSSASPAPSHVLLAIGRSYDEALSALRFGVGRFTTEQEIDRAVILVTDAVRAARSESLPARNAS
ncbi:cysteine desulfurase family protein [Iamia majanohamensis]|uniref:cysteine desulfurase n=1 Tax=Iamia majanohamensis TaxID=467976 RepID=A0AAE9Y868_9ACTN|nr:cysteine desulfurase family protein [Iamia majanohamensis]WCO66243.1 cysteine desulfurase family protein [Iamia majanohamensis]